MSSQPPIQTHAVIEYLQIVSPISSFQSCKTDKRNEPCRVKVSGAMEQNLRMSLYERRHDLSAFIVIDNYYLDPSFSQQILVSFEIPVFSNDHPGNAIEQDSSSAHAARAASSRLKPQCVILKMSMDRKPHLRVVYCRPTINRGT